MGEPVGPRIVARRRPTLSDTFDPRANGLNAVRLVLAVGVIVWHSFPLTDRTISAAPVRQLMGEVWVDGFFAVSGFLITMSWVRNPHVLDYLRSRALRILPAFYVCLVVTAFVFAPLAAGSGHGDASLADGAAYVRANLLLRINAWAVGTTPSGIPYEGVWNGSLWTLYWEALCYLGVLAVGTAGLLRWPRRAAVGLFGLAYVGSVVAEAGLIQWSLVATGSRFALMFTAGMLVHGFASVLPVTRRLLLAAGAVVVAAALLPDYRLVAAPFLAYTVIGLGSMLKSPRWNLRNDLSYGTYIYAFPVQQGLAMAGLWATVPVVGFVLLSVILTLPLAATSWWLVEKPALRLRRRPAREPTTKAHEAG